MAVAMGSWIVVAVGAVLGGDGSILVVSRSSVGTSTAPVVVVARGPVSPTVGVASMQTKLSKVGSKATVGGS